MDDLLRFNIHSDYLEGRTVQKRILEEVEKHRYGEDAQFAIKLALEEGLINAIKHGNKLDKTKKVKIEAHVSDEQVEIMIEDEGPGFDRSTVPDPTTDENIERLHGRGILLMEAYMHHIEWSRGGRRVKMVLKKDKGNRGSAA